MEQITDGQLEWEPLNDTYDIVQIEYDEAKRRLVNVFVFFHFLKIVKKIFIEI